MIDYLYQTNDLNLFLILSSFFIAISMLALLVIKYCMPLHLRYQENAVIGCTSSLIVVIYGVLAGFASLYLINAVNGASDAVQRESDSIANLHRDNIGLSNPIHARIEAMINQYLDQVLNVEWPLMSKGKMITYDGAFIINNIVKELTHAQINPGIESTVLADMLIVTRNLYDARQQRILISYASLNIEVWVVILLGTVLSLCVSYLFGVNFYLHVFIVIAAALMTSSIIFLLISLDKPFQGGYIVGPDSFKSVAEIISTYDKQNPT